MSEGNECNHDVEDVEESCCVEGHEDTRIRLAAVARQSFEGEEVAEGAGEVLGAAGAMRISPLDADEVAAADDAIGVQIGGLVDGLLQMMRS